MTPAVAGALPDFALAGIGVRLAEHPPLTDLVPEDDIEEGPDQEVWNQPSRELFPAVRFEISSVPDERGLRFGTVRVQVDEFVWPSDPDAPSGRSGIAEIDGVIVGDLLGETRQWRYRGHQFSVSQNDMIANELDGEPFRRGRRLKIEVTP